MQANNGHTASSHPWGRFRPGHPWPGARESSEQYLLVTGSHGRIMYWEYRGSMDELRGRLAEAELMLP